MLKMRGVQAKSEYLRAAEPKQCVDAKHRDRIHNLATASKSSIGPPLEIHPNARMDSCLCMQAVVRTSNQAAGSMDKLSAAACTHNHCSRSSRRASRTAAACSSNHSVHGSKPGMAGVAAVLNNSRLDNVGSNWPARGTNKTNSPRRRQPRAGSPKELSQRQSGGGESPVVLYQ